MKSVIDEAYENLGFAIVERAVEDYKTAIKQKNALEERMILVDRMISDCKRFFKSENMKLYSGLESMTYDEIIETLNEKAREERKDESITVTIKIKLKDGRRPTIE